MYLFSYTGGRAAPQTPLLLFGTVGGQEYEYIGVGIIMYTSIMIHDHFLYTGGRASSQTHPVFFGTAGGWDYEYILVDIIMFTNITIDMHFLILGGVPPPRPPCFFSARSAGQNTSK